MRVTHLPTGVAAESRSERSQHKNHETALKLLRAKLLLLEEQRHGSEHALDSSGEPGWTYRVRHYTLHPHPLVRDLRTGVEVDEVQDVLDGNLDVFSLANLWQAMR